MKSIVISVIDWCFDKFECKLLLELSDLIDYLMEMIEVVKVVKRLVIVDDISLFLF